jgi:hypothetical protein
VLRVRAAGAERGVYLRGPFFDQTHRFVNLMDTLTGTGDGFDFRLIVEGIVHEIDTVGLDAWAAAVGGAPNCEAAWSLNPMVN